MRMSTAAPAALLLALALLGCAVAPAPVAGIHGDQPVVEATEKQVEDCEFRGTVSGIGLPWGDYNRGRNKAMEKVLAEAGARGGTHVVIEDVRDTGQGIEAVGRAFRCKRGA